MVLQMGPWSFARRSLERSKSKQCGPRPWLAVLQLKIPASGCRRRWGKGGGTLERREEPGGGLGWAQGWREWAGDESSAAAASGGALSRQEERG